MKESANLLKDYMPTIIKALKIIAIIVVIILVIRYARKLIDKIGENQDRKNLMNQMGQDIIESELTYPNSQYLQYAETIYQALKDRKSGFWGVDQGKIYGVYRSMKTNSDVLKLHDSFGTRYIDTAWTLGKDGRYSLAEAIPALMTRGQLREINSILAENGITFSYSNED